MSAWWRKPPGSWPTAVLPACLVGAACLFNLVAYLPELVYAAPDINDHVFHHGLLQRMNQTWQDGGNPLDNWIPYWGQGFPVLRYYQHLPHLAVVLIYRMLQGMVPLHTVFEAFRVVLLVLVPMAFCSGARFLGFDRLAASLVALCTPFLGADPAQRYFFGFQTRSFIWSGGGLFTQLTAMVFFAVALGLVHRTTLEGRRYGWSLVCLSATWLSHLVLGYMACLLGLLVLVRPEAGGKRLTVLARLGVLYLGTAAIVSYLLLPSLMESALLSRSVWEAPEYWDSFGARRVLEALATGGLLDGDRFPALTLLAACGLIGAVVHIYRRKTATGPSWFAVLSLGTALLLFFGRPTWGAALSALPFSRNLPFHRFICAVQYSGLLLAGLGLSWLLELLGWSRSLWRTVLSLLLLGIFLSPAVLSTVRTARESAAWQRQYAAEFESAGGPLRATLDDFDELNRARPARGYAGTSWDWGREFEVAGARVYSYWTGHDIPAISYMYHTMGLNSDLEPEFDPSRRDHYELFNVRFLVADDRTRLPEFSVARAARAGVYSATVDTGGYFDIVGVDRFFSAADAEQGDLHRLNQRYVDSAWHGQHRFFRIGWQRGDQAAEGEIEIGPDFTFPLPQSGSWTPARGHVVEYWGHGDEYGAIVHLDEAGHVLFRMTYHTAWTAMLDGRPVDTVMLSPSFVGVEVPPGDHRIEMTYQPGSWTTVLFWAGIALIGLTFLGDRLRLWPSVRGEPRPSTRRIFLEITGVLFGLAALLFWTGILP